MIFEVYFAFTVSLYALIYVCETELAVFSFA